MPATIYDVEALKDAARGRWPEILSALAGVPRDSLDGKHHACPWCGGEDRFRAFNDFEETGGVICNQCHSSENGDGIAAVMKGARLEFPAAVEGIGRLILGLVPRNGRANGHVTDPLETVCQAKRMPKASSLAFGARAVSGGAAFPSWGPDGEPLGERPRAAEQARVARVAAARDRAWLPARSRHGRTPRQAVSLELAPSCGGVPVVC